MTGFEIGALVAVFSAVFLFLFAVRRASERKQLPNAERKRLRDRRRERDEESEVEAEEAEAEAEPATSRGKQRRPAARVEHAEPDADADPDEDADEDADEERDRGAADDKLREGLAKTRGGFVAKLGKLFSKKQIDEDILGELEEVLFTADIGPKTAARLFDAVKGSLSRSELQDPDAVWAKLREESASILDVGAKPIDFAVASPTVLLVLGVNGVGKTTTIGKIAAKLTAEGKKVLLAAGDTFRAAAVEQLEIWGQRAGAPVVKGKSGGDPSSVIFDAVKRAQDEGFDILIADTAGRLHTKVDLMEELQKVRRVIDKAQPGAPHETWLVLDSTTGQNAIQQAQMFKQALDVTGIVLTKLDGTAKGGVVLGICGELNLPVRFIGIGEQVADLRPFEARAFVEALYEESPTADAA